MSTIKQILLAIESRQQRLTQQEKVELKKSKTQLKRLEKRQKNEATN